MSDDASTVFANPRQHHYPPNAAAAIRLMYEVLRPVEWKIDEYVSSGTIDAVQAIEWMSQQPWCTGNVGMFVIVWRVQPSVANAPPGALKYLPHVFPSTIATPKIVTTRGEPFRCP
jgi:hypothetical protein